MSQTLHAAQPAPAASAHYLRANGATDYAPLVPAGQDRAPECVENHHSDARFVVAETSADRLDFMRTFGVEFAPQAAFSITEMARSSRGHGMTEQRQKAESYSVCIHLTDFSDYDIWCDDRHTASHEAQAGAVHIGDMRRTWRADIRNPFHVVNYYVPQAVLDEVGDENDVQRIEELNCTDDAPRVDPVLRNLTLALLPALRRPDQVNRLFADYAGRTVIAHLAKTYGSFHHNRRYASGRLAPWQERRAKELLAADLSGGINLSDLASACRLSTSHFSRAFRQTVGCPPHQWLLRQRVERAKQLILNTRQPLCEIALATGFADQSHFTRAFTQRVKASPAAWRRAQER